MACVVTNLAASCGGLTWLLMNYFQATPKHKWGLVEFCSGAMAGLVAITPAAGFVPPWAAVIIGVVAGVVCNLGTNLRSKMGIDDHLDIFALHAIGGLVGNLLTYLIFLFLANASEGCLPPTISRHSTVLR